MYPKEIIIEDQDGGYIIAEYSRDTEDADEHFIPIYKYKEYYHDLESAVKEVKL